MVHEIKTFASEFLRSASLSPCHEDRPQKLSSVEHVKPTTHALGTVKLKSTKFLYSISQEITS